MNALVVSLTFGQFIKFDNHNWSKLCLGFVNFIIIMINCVIDDNYQLLALNSFPIQLTG